MNGVKSVPQSPIDKKERKNLINEQNKTVNASLLAQLYPMAGILLTSLIMVSHQIAEYHATKFTDLPKRDIT